MMNTLLRKSTAILLLTILSVGCGTTYVPRDEWTYIGSNRTWNDLPPSRRYNEALWWEERREVIDREKDSCAMETGDSKTPGYWLGYSRSFKDCMKLRGWRDGGYAL